LLLAGVKEIEAAGKLAGNHPGKCRGFLPGKGKRITIRLLLLRKARRFVVLGRLLSKEILCIPPWDRNKMKVEIKM